jgi:16S rRNA (guanine1516-N2)-methyltransferase
VEAVEGHEELYEVLKIALSRVSSSSSEDAGSRLRLSQKMASQKLKELSVLPAHLRPEVIYLDPMFPQEGKSALPKKRMQILRSLFLQAEPLEELLQESLRWARNRVVLKRGLKDPMIWRKPHSQVKGKSVRFDVYLTANRT